MHKIGLLLLGLCLGIFQGCKSVIPYPEAWSPPQKQSVTGHPAPVGLFSNQGESNQTKLAAPTLSALFFDNKLEGFDIDTVRISETADSRKLLIKPKVGPIELEMERLLVANHDAGHPDRWFLKSTNDYADGYDATASLLWTGGLFLPLAAWKNYSLHLAEDGALLVHVKEKELVDFFFFFPATMTDEIWLKYPSITPDIPAEEIPKTLDKASL